MALIQFSGLASGIDTASLIDAIIESRGITNELRKADIQLLEDTNDALEELNTKILALDDLIDGFRTANGGGVEKKATSSDTSVATAIVGSNAINASYDLTVNSTANTGTAGIEKTGGYSGTDDTFTDAGLSGTLTVSVGTGGDQVQLTAAWTAGVTSVQEVIDELNADPDAAGRAVVSYVEKGTDSSPDGSIVVSSLESGTALGQVTVGASSVDILTTYSQATDADFDIGGIGNIIRSSNTVGDVISGVTFTLLATGSTTVSVGNDADATSDKVEAIVDAYNEIVEYITDNDTVTRVEDGDDATNVFGSLAKTNVDNDFLSQFRLEIAGASSANGSAVTSMSEMGISTNRDGTLSFDSEDFVEAVGEDYEGVGEVLNDFADNVSGVAGLNYQFTKFQGYIDISQDANDSQIESLNDSIASLERTLDKLREGLEIRYARLETTVGKLQGQESALAGVLAGL